MYPSIARRAAPALFLLGILATPGSATTIDFESPDLGSDPWIQISPYQSNGVSFSASMPVGLVQECELLIGRGAPCGPCENQWLGSAVSPNCPVGVQAAPLRADFLPEAGPVLAVSVVVQTLSYTTLLLHLYNASDELIGQGQAGVALAYENCGDDETGEMTSRGLVSAEATQPIAYAVVAVIQGWICPGIPGCYSECNPFAIDDFTFSSGSVPTRRTAWGELKLLYR